PCALAVLTRIVEAASTTRTTIARLVPLIDETLTCPAGRHLILHARSARQKHPSSAQSTLSFAALRGGEPCPTFREVVAGQSASGRYAASYCRSLLSRQRQRPPHQEQHPPERRGFTFCPLHLDAKAAVEEAQPTPTISPVRVSG